jgi:PAS domain S-box-containing protein
MSSNSKEMVENPQADELVIDDAIYHSLYNAMSVGIHICNLQFDEKGKPNDFIFLAVNPAYEKQTGFRAEQVIGKRATEFMPYADTLWFDLAEEAINSQKATSGEVYNQPLDRWFKIFASPLPGNNLFALFFEDITERKKAEEILSKAKDDMSAILENINLGIMSLDNNWRFKYVNKKAVEGIGRKPEELVGKDLRQEFPWLTTLKAVGLFQKVMDNRTIVSIEERGAISDRYYKHTICPIPDGIFLFWEDITERKQLEKALKESEERHAFLLKLSNMLRTVSDPLEIYESTVRVVMEQFHTDRCYFTELKEGEAVIHRESKREGLPPILGWVRYQETTRLPCNDRYGCPTCRGRCQNIGFAG